MPHTTDMQGEACSQQGLRTGRDRWEGQVGPPRWEEGERGGMGEERDPAQTPKRVLQATQLLEPTDAGGRCWGARAVQLQLF